MRAPRESSTSARRRKRPSHTRYSSARLAGAQNLRHSLKRLRASGMISLTPCSTSPGDARRRNHRQAMVYGRSKLTIAPLVNILIAKLSASCVQSDAWHVSGQISVWHARRISLPSKAIALVTATLTALAESMCSTCTRMMWISARRTTARSVPSPRPPPWWHPSVSRVPTTAMTASSMRIQADPSATGARGASNLIKLVGSAF